MYLNKIQNFLGLEETRSKHLDFLLTSPTHMPVFMRMR